MNIMKMIKKIQNGMKQFALVMAAVVCWAGQTQAATNIYWILSGGGDWDTATANWVGATTVYTNNGTVDVSFTNNAGGTINISPNMIPRSTAVSAASGTYIFTGGPIASGTLTKSGLGTLRLAGVNSITNLTVSGSGNGTSGSVLELTSAAALGSPSRILLYDSAKLSLLSDGSVNFGPNIWHNSNFPHFTINVDRAPSGSGSGGVHSIGNIDLQPANTMTITVTGSNGYGLNVGAMTSTRNFGSITHNGPGLLTIASLATCQAFNSVNGSITFSGSGTTRVTGTIAGISPLLNPTLTYSGTGSLILEGTNPYGGATTISNGKIVGVTGGSCENSDVTLSAGTLSILVTDNTKQWSCKSLTRTGGTLNFDFNTNMPSASIAPLLVKGNVAFTSPTVSILVTNTLAVGTYPLMKMTGVGTTPSSVTLPSPLYGTLFLDAPNKTVWLNNTITRTNQPLTWMATGGSNWNISATANWTNNIGAAVTYEESTLAGVLVGDSVIFNDKNALTTPITVTLGTTVSPASVNVNNPSKAYTLSGSGGISGGASLTKDGAGKLTLATVNSYAGGTTIKAGMLAISADNNLGTSGIPLSINGGTLDTGANVLALTGRLVNIFSGGATFTNASNGSLTADSVITGGGNLTKSGAGTLAFTGNGATNTLGTVTVNNGGGTLAFTGNGATNTLNLLTVLRDSTVIITNGAVLSFPSANPCLKLGRDSNNGTVIVSGANSRFIVANGSLYLGSDNGTDNRGNSNQLTIANGGWMKVGNSSKITALAGTNNVITVTGAGSTYEQQDSNIGIGTATRATGNSLVITNGGLCFLWQNGHTFSIGGAIAASSNSVVVTGTGSALSMGGGNLFVSGRNIDDNANVPGSNNFLRVEDGGAVTNLANLWVGNSNAVAGANNNFVRVASNGKLLLTGTLALGSVSNANNTVSIAGGIVQCNKIIAYTNNVIDFPNKSTGTLYVRTNLVAGVNDLITAGKITAKGAVVTPAAFTVVTNIAPYLGYTSCTLKTDSGGTLLLIK